MENIYTYINEHWILNILDIDLEKGNFNLY